ncbi:MAG TPA: papain-like cysteine protease family protein [Anaerolineales bacterium]|nr:papain-like cysteine protease family protein [Anaerolineales bacterium]
METQKLTRLKIISLIGMGALALAGFRQMLGQYSISRLKQDPLNLQVSVVKQLTGTSCGEAVIVMVYNYAHPLTPLNEQEVIEFATAQGYFTPGVPPFTSPANMVKIAENYVDNISAGNVKNSSEGLSFLIRTLRAGEPVIIDVLSNFSDSESEAHFIVTTGISVDPARGNAVVIHYNDPLTGTKESADWSGSEGVWNAWQNNGDPGGSGWWLAIDVP